MSTISIPGTPPPKDTMLNETGTHGQAEMSAEIAGTVNLMAHPLAGVAAMSAIGLGFASQAVGAWFGALSGAATASHRLFSPMFDEYEADAFREPRAPVTRAQSSIAKLARDVDATVVHLKPRVGAPAPVVQKKEIDATLPLAAKVDSKDALPGKRPVTLEKHPRVKAEPKHRVPVLQKAAEARQSAGAATRGTAMKVKPAAMTKPAAMSRPEQPDDLKSIAGLGPKVEQVLNGLGVWTFSQVATWSDAEIAWVDDLLGFNGRILRDDWLGQAKTLAAAKA